MGSSYVVCREDPHPQSHGGSEDSKYTQVVCLNIIVSTERWMLWNPAFSHRRRFVIVPLNTIVVTSVEVLSFQSFCGVLVGMRKTCQRVNGSHNEVTLKGNILTS